MYSPCSPQDRVYTTPDATLPSINQILQRIRLEKVLRKVGLLPCCMSFWQPVDVNHGVFVPHQTYLEPFGSLEKKEWKPLQAITADKRQENFRQPERNSKFSKLPSVTSKQPQRKEQEAKQRWVRHTCCASEKRLRNPHVVAGKNALAGNAAYLGSHEYYKPFYPTKPVQLPSLRNDSTLDKMQIIAKPKQLTGRSNEGVMRAEFERDTKQETECRKYHEKEMKWKKRQRRKEQEFREWTESQENYFGKPLDFDLYDAPLFESQEKFHDTEERWKKSELYRRDVGLTYFDMVPSSFKRHLAVPKITAKKKQKKTKTMKTSKHTKKPDFKQIL